MTLLLKEKEQINRRTTDALAKKAMVGMSKINMNKNGTSCLTNLLIFFEDVPNKMPRRINKW